MRNRIGITDEASEGMTGWRIRADRQALVSLSAAIDEVLRHGEQSAQMLGRSQVNSFKMSFVIVESLEET